MGYLPDALFTNWYFLYFLWKGKGKAETCHPENVAWCYVIVKGCLYCFDQLYGGKKV